MPYETKAMTWNDRKRHVFNCSQPRPSGRQLKPSTTSYGVGLPALCILVYVFRLHNRQNLKGTDGTQISALQKPLCVNYSEMYCLLHQV